MRSLKLFYIAGTLLLILYLVAEYNKPSPINWTPTLSYNDKIPYGTYVTYKQLKDIFPGSELRNTNLNFYDQFHGKNDSSSNYLIIAKGINFSKYDFKELTRYLKSGNSVFIAASQWNGLLADTLNIQASYLLKNDTTVGLNFTSNKLKRAGNYQFKKDIADAYFSKFDTTRAIVLSQNQFGKSNLLCYKFGAGNLYLCANPLLFTNYSLLKDAGADYAAKAFSYMPVRPVMYWDHFQNGDIMVDESPMRVIFNYPSLRWAYYISLCAILIFIFYEMKRRQRIIPVIEPLKNATVYFVNVVGQVYYEQRNNLNMAQKKIQYFLEHLRTKYYLKTNSLDTGFAETLANKTGIEGSLARDMVNHFNYISVQTQVTDRELILLNQLIEQFYIQSR